jgi:hypothetical protein
MLRRSKLSHCSRGGLEAGPSMISICHWRVNQAFSDEKITEEGCNTTFNYVTYFDI